MSKKSRLLVGLSLLLAAFIAGFAPQYIEKGRLQGQLDSANGRLEAMQSDLKMAELRDLSGLMLTEVLRRNYGSAAEYSSRYFEKVRQASQETANAARQEGLRELLANRDPITAVLAQADPASAAKIQQLYARTFEVTRNE